MSRDDGGRPASHISVPLARELWDEVVAEWGLEPGEALALLGCAGDGGPMDEAGVPGTAERMRLAVSLAVLARQVLGGGEVRAWLRRPNAMMGGATPLERMAASPEWTRWLVDALSVAT